MTMELILVLHAGSSTLKASLFEASADVPLLAHERITRIGSQSELFWNGVAVTEISKTLDHPDALRELVAWINRGAANWRLGAVEFLIVNGGDLFSTSALLTSQKMQQLEALVPLAPQHQSNCLAAVYALVESYPNLMQIACFDKAFYKNHSPGFQQNAFPKSLGDQVIRRYGSHGLSCEWVAQELVKEQPHLTQGRGIAMHLGNGANLCAMQAGAIQTARRQQASSILPSFCPSARIPILERSRGGERDVASLAKAAGLAHSSVSQRLMVLREHRVVSERRDG